MTDLTLAAQDAIFAALDVAAVTSIAPVHQHVPEDTQPPIVVLGDMNVVPIGGKDGGLDQIGFEIITLVRQPRRSALFALQYQVRLALEGVTLPVQSGASLSPPVFESSDEEVLEDGQTYLGTQRFSLIAQPA